MTFKALRQSRKLTQEQLEAVSGVDKATISAIETGRTKSPTAHNVAALAKALGVKMEELMDAIARTEEAA